MRSDLIRSDFPILEREINGFPLVYLDNGATTQKPRQVLDAVQEFYRRSNANIHRSVYTLATEATELYVEAHKTVAAFIGASSYREIVFGKNTTEALNLLAASLGASVLKAGETILLTVAEHHSNLLPWLKLEETMGVHVRTLPVTEEGRIDMDAYTEALSLRPRVVTLPHVSNVLGIINDVRAIAELAHEVGALVVVDGAQAVPHMKVNVQELGVDAYAFAAHKMVGPLGIGALQVREELLEQLSPFLRGGDMIRDVRYDPASQVYDVMFNDLPWRFEAGTANIAGAVGFEAAIRYLEGVGYEEINLHAQKLYRKLVDGLTALDGITFLVPPAEEESTIGTVTFSVRDYSADDIAAFMDTQGIAIRSGRHCAHPLHTFFGVPATVRVTPYIYNTEEEIEQCLLALKTLL